MERKVDHRKLLSELHYDPNTGHLTWRVDKRPKKAGDRAGGLHRNYRKIKFGGHQYREHRLIWFYVHKRWPVGEVDHINRDGTDNRIENLREVSSAVNCQNMRLTKRSGTGYRYVRFVDGKYYVRVSIPGSRNGLGKQKSIGGRGFDSMKEAVSVRNRWLYENRHMYPAKFNDI